MYEPNWQIVVNNHSKAGKTAKNWHKTAKKYNITYPVHFTNSLDDLQILINNWAINTTNTNGVHIISVGGDGSLNALVNAIAHQTHAPMSAFTIAALPCGTGNDWLRTHFAKPNFEKILAAIQNQTTITHSIGKITDNEGTTRHFINIAGFGFDAHTAKKLNHWRTKGLHGVASYIVALVAGLSSYKVFRGALWFEDKVHQKQIFNLNIGCCRYAGGGMMLLPSAQPTNGFFDVTIVNNISKIKVLTKIPLLFNGKFIKEKEIEQHQMTKLVVACQHPILAEIDGEVLPTSLRFSIEILPAAIKVISSL
jgi:YegS/Rv2252/BmrU family lipid kinase